LTLKIASISANVLERVQLRQVADPLMKSLTAITNETTHLAILEGSEFVYIGKVDNKQAVRMRSRVGQRGQLYCTAVGKAMLAFLPENDLPPHLSKIGYKKLTEKTIKDEEMLLNQLSQIRKQGWAIDDEENEIGIRCIGAPIFDHRGRMVGALSISGWTITMTHERVMQYSTELINVCQAISKELGFVKSE
jgi:DNA-binding IclR family transcriptional regulator